MKMLTAFLFACFLATAFSQSDSVYLYSLKTILSPAHLVASPKGEVYIVEVYHSFKNNYWFSAWDTLSQAELSERTKKMVVRHLTDCDSLVNHIRNEAYLDLKTLEMNDYAREKLSYRNNYSWLTIKSSLKTRVNQCQQPYREQLNQELTWIRRQIDSLFQEKEKLYAKLVNGSFHFDNAGLLNYLNNSGRTERDYKIFEWLILNDTRNFVSVIEKMDENDFFNFTLAMNRFPAGSKVEEMKSALKKLDFGGSRKNKLCKKIRSKS